MNEAGFKELRQSFTGTSGETKIPQIENKAKILVKGLFDPQDITITTTDHRIPLTPGQHTVIENVWGNEGKKYFDGPLVRVNSYNLTPEGKLSIVLGRTSYKEFLGTRDKASRIRYSYDHIANPLLASAVVITSDNKILISKRGQDGDLPGEIDALGGHIDPQEDVDENGNIDIFKAVKRETREETGLNEDEIDEIKCLGLTYQYRNVSHVTASFALTTKLSSTEILARKAEEITVIAADLDKIPHEGSEEYILKILGENYPNIEPEARVTVALARMWKANPHDSRLKKKQYRTKDEIER